MSVFSKLKTHRVIAVLLTLLFLVFAIRNSFLTEIGFLNVFGVDEFEHVKYLYRQWDGVNQLNPILFLSSPGFVYGFGFYGLSFLVTWPFLLFKLPFWVVFMPRMVSAVSVLLMLGCSFLLLRRVWSEKMSLILSSFWVLSPLFWKFGTWNHPDALMWGLFALSVLLLSRDFDLDTRLRRFYWWSLGVFALAVSVKIQIFMLSPIWVFYLLLNVGSIPRFFSMSFKSLGLFFGLYLLVCPYLIHPVGRAAFIRSTVETYACNITNHRQFISVSLWDKLSVVSADVMVSFLFVVVALVGIVLVFRAIYGILKKDRSYLFLGILAASGWMALGYLLIFVNKAWSHYYVPVVWVLWLGCLLVMGKKWGQRRSLSLWGLLVVVLLIQGVLAWPALVHVVSVPTLTVQQRSINRLLLDQVRPFVRSDSHILISSKMPFDYTRLGLRHDQVITLYGPLTKDMFDETAFLQKWKSVNLKKYPVRNFYKKDLIILSKTDQAVLQFGKVHDSVWQRSDDLIRGLFSGKMGWELCSETPYFWIFKLGEN